jgi:hypothetical protein
VKRRNAAAVTQPGRRVRARSMSPRGPRSAGWRPRRDTARQPAAWPVAGRCQHSSAGIAARIATGTVIRTEADGQPDAGILQSCCGRSWPALTAWRRPAPRCWSSRCAAVAGRSPRHGTGFLAAGNQDPAPAARRTAGTRARPPAAPCRWLSTLIVRLRPDVSIGCIIAVSRGPGTGGVDVLTITIVVSAALGGGPWPACLNADTTKN